MSKTLTKRRASLNHELKQRVAEEIVRYITRNPGKQIPNTAIADKFSINSHQVKTATDYLLRSGKFEQVSFKTYSIPMFENDIPEPLQPESATEEQKPLLQRPPLFIELFELAKTYYWETNGSNNLRSFMEWLEKGLSK